MNHGICHLFLSIYCLFNLFIYHPFLNFKCPTLYLKISLYQFLHFLCLFPNFLEFAQALLTAFILVLLQAFLQFAHSHLNQFPFFRLMLHSASLPSPAFLRQSLPYHFQCLLIRVWCTVNSLFWGGSPNQLWIKLTSCLLLLQMLTNLIY